MSFMRRALKISAAKQRQDVTGAKLSRSPRKQTPSKGASIQKNKKLRTSVKISQLKLKSEWIGDLGVSVHVFAVLFNAAGDSATVKAATLHLSYYVLFKNEVFERRAEGSSETLLIKQPKRLSSKQKKNTHYLRVYADL